MSAEDHASPTAGCGALLPQPAEHGHLRGTLGTVPSDWRIQRGAPCAERLSMAGQGTGGLRNRHRWTTTVRVLMTALLTSLLAWGALPATQAHAATQYGYDISWPQCGRDLTPLQNGDFMIIGLTNGLAFTENPCLQAQVGFATQNAIPVHGYAMATFPNATQLTTHGSSGPWNSSTRAGKLSNVGYAEAQYAINSLSRIGWRPDVVWIDVEPRPKSPWPGATATQRIENRYVIEGLVRGLRDAGFGYGFYSYTNGWNEITDGWSLPGIPVWATAGKLDYPNEALDRCSQASFSGGKVYLSQWYDDVQDYDRTCGDYAFTKLPRNLTGTQGVKATASSWNSAEKSPAIAVTDGSTVGYPVDSRMEWTTAHQGTGAWIELTWPNPVRISRIVLHDRPDPDAQVTAGTLSFSDKSTVSVSALPNDGSSLSVSFPEKTVTSVRFTVGSVSAGTWSTGLSEMEVWGSEYTPFSDVSTSDPNYSAILWLAAQNISTGWPDGTFRPNQQIDRDAMAAFFYRFQGSPAFTAPASSPFTDIDPGLQFYKEMAWMKTSGISTGWPDATYRPWTITYRDAMSAFLYRVAGSPAYTPPTVSPFSDINPSTQFYKEMCWAAQNGIVNDVQDGTFDAWQPVTREMMAGFMYRLDKITD